MYPLIEIGKYTLHTHALTNLMTLILFGIGVYFRVGKRFQSKSIHEDIDSVFKLVVGVIAGAWAAYILPYAVRFIFRQPVPPQWWLLGTHWMGYLAGGMLAGYWVCKRNGWPFWRIADGYAPLLALALAIGRSGCLLAGDAFGRVTDSWVAMYLPDLVGNWAYRYPTQYVSILMNLLLAAILFGFEYTTQKKLGKPSGWPFDGFLFLLYVELFCFQRFIFDFWRADNPILIGHFHWTHLYCVLGMIWVTWMMVKRWKENQVIG
jgi:prolipoprotein diacylglyceryltransferase